jgi:hypoxanthine phosphoribosyltransferase
VGFEVPDEFVVGYGIDFAGAYRNLTDIHALKPEGDLPTSFPTLLSED